MRKLTQMFFAVAMIAGGSAFAQTATQTVTTNVAGAMSISLSDGVSNDVASLSTTMVSKAAGQSATGSVTVNVNSSETSGFHVTADGDATGTTGHMCEWNGTAYTTTCLASALSVAGTSSIAAGTGTGGGGGDLTTTETIFSSSNTVSSGTITADLTQPIGWTDTVLGSTSYRMIITYTIVSGV